MKIYRSTMERILDKQEDDTVITNPKARLRTFLRKVRFVLSRWGERIRGVFN